MSGLLDFLSAEAGQRRTRARDEAIENVFSWLLGPTGIPDRLNAIGLLNPVQDIYEAGGNARDGDYAGAAINTASALMPVAGAKLAGGGLADDAANIISDTLTNVGTRAQGAMDAGQAFAADEFGGVGPSRMRVDELLRSEDGQANAAKSYLEGGFAPSNSPVKVAMTPDGKPYLVDGYHRAEWAAREGDGIIPVEYVDFDKIKVLYDNERSFLPTKPAGIRAYHGSPHDFDRFSMDAIGTGEGAQAYGHGLYFAENEGVARGYRDALAGRIDVQPVQIDGVRYEPPTEQHQRVAAIIAKDGRRNAMATLRSLRDQDLLEPEQEQIWKQILADTKGKDVQPLQGGRMYEVNINANPDDFLDWDAPLSEQPRVLEKFGFNDAKYPEDWIPDVNMTGADLYRLHGGKTSDGARGGDSAAPSGVLTGASRPIRMKDGTIQDKAVNIPGIKYKDAGSRGADGGTRNFVVFDENLIEIVRKYGIAGAAAITGLSVAEIEGRMNGT